MPFDGVSLLRLSLARRSLALSFGRLDALIVIVVIGSGLLALALTLCRGRGPFLLRSFDVLVLGQIDFAFIVFLGVGIVGSLLFGLFECLLQVGLFFRLSLLGSDNLRGLDERERMRLLIVAVIRVSDCLKIINGNAR